MKTERSHFGKQRRDRIRRHSEAEFTLGKIGAIASTEAQRRSHSRTFLQTNVGWVEH
ncbi:hypothetical protein IQ258_15005 [Coleofasciculus sp. LEGE 07081]|nr:hypothetical protein [Coleofasciculus sp. LEGE 07081]